MPRYIRQEAAGEMEECMRWLSSHCTRNKHWLGKQLQVQYYYYDCDPPLTIILFVFHSNQKTLIQHLQRAAVAKAYCKRTNTKTDEWTRQNGTHTYSIIMLWTVKYKRNNANFSCNNFFNNVCTVANYIEFMRYKTKRNMFMISCVFKIIYWS